MLTFVEKYGGNVHSQNGEDLITSEVCRRLGLTSGHAVEIGGNDGHWMSNTRNLIENGWKCLFVEADYSLHLKCKENWSSYPEGQVRSQCSRVDEHNINAFVDERCDLLSLDTDGSDYKIFQGMKARPKIVIVEIDSSIPPDSLEFNSDGAAGYASMVKLGLVKGYFLLCHVGNVLMVLNEFRELFPDIISDGLSNSDLYFNPAWITT